LAPSTLDRQARNYFPTATILKFLGEDYRTFMTAFSTVKMQELAEFGGMIHEYQKIWNAVLHTTINLSQHSKEHQGMIALISMLSNQDFLEILKATDLGVYYIPSKKWLIVFWQRVLSGILRFNNSYRNFQDYHRLKMMADQDPRVIPREQITPTFLKKYVWPRLRGISLSADDISIINLTQTLEEIVQSDTDIIEPVTADMEAKQRVLSDITVDIKTGNPKKGSF
jgi:hypothetical protein